MKKTLGVTGTISSAVTRLLAESGYELWLLNLGNRAAEMPAGVPLKPCHAASDILSAVAPQAYDMEGKLLGDKAVSVVFDNSKLKSLVPGFHAQVPFADGVRRTIDHIMKHPELQVEDPEFEAWCDRVVEALLLR